MKATHGLQDLARQLDTIRDRSQGDGSYRAHLAVTREDPRTFVLLAKVPRTMRPELHREYAESFERTQEFGGDTPRQARNQGLSLMNYAVATYLLEHSDEWAEYSHAEIMHELREQCRHYHRN